MVSDMEERNTGRLGEESPSEQATCQEPQPKRVGLFGKFFPQRSTAAHVGGGQGAPLEAPAPVTPAQEGETDSESGELVDTMSPTLLAMEPSSGISVFLQGLSKLTTGAYTVASRGAKALQKLTGQEHIRDFHEARARLEKAAKELRGKERETMVRRWCEVLRENTVPAPARPLMLGSSPGIDGEWQQLQGPFGMSMAEDEVARGADVLFLDNGQEGAEPMTFRDLFLRSRAFEYIVAGYTVAPPASQDEQDQLVNLFKACLSGNPELHTKTVADLMQLAEAQVRCQEAGTKPEELHSLGVCIAQCINGVKRQAEAEGIERRILALESEIRDRAADAAHRHVFSSRENEPVGDCSPHKLEKGLAATAQVMRLLEQLCGLVSQRRALLESAPWPPFEAMLSTMHSKSGVLAEELAATEAKIASTHKEHQEKEVERGRVLNRMAGDLKEVASEISELEERQQALLLQLREVETDLVRARSRRTDKEEAKSAFDDLITFSLMGLQQQSEDLARDQRRREAQAAALELGVEVVEDAQAGCATVAAQQAAAARVAQAEAERELLAATARHCYFQRGELQLLLRRAEFCSGELKSQLEKAEELATMGMSSMLKELQKQRRSCQAKYLEAEAAALKHLQEVSEIRMSIIRLCSINVFPSDEGSPSAVEEGTVEGATPAPREMRAGAGTAAVHEASDRERIVEELRDLLASIDDIGRRIRSLPRPEGLPPPGQPLPPDPEEEQKDGDASPTGSGGRSGSSGRRSPPSVSDPRNGLAPISTSRSSSEEGTGAGVGVRTRVGAALPMSRQGSSSGNLASALGGQGISRPTSNGAGPGAILAALGTQGPSMPMTSNGSSKPSPQTELLSLESASSMASNNSPPSLIEDPRCSMPSAREHMLPGNGTLGKLRLPHSTLVPAVRRVSFEVPAGTGFGASAGSTSLPIMPSGSPSSSGLDGGPDGCFMSTPAEQGPAHTFAQQEHDVVHGFGFGDLEDLTCSGQEPLNASALLGDDLLMMGLESSTLGPPAGPAVGSLPPQMGGLKAALAQCADAERNCPGAYARSEMGNSRAGDIQAVMGFLPGSSRHSEATSFLPTSGLPGKGYGMDGSFNSSNGSNTAASGPEPVAMGN